MEYNKNRCRKINDQKVLHKVGKQWVVLSLATLMSLGLGVATAHVSAHANSNVNPLKQRLNTSLQGGGVQHHLSVPSHPAQSSTYNGRQNTYQNVNQQADALHNRIIGNAMLNHSANTQARVPAKHDQDQSISAKPVNTQAKNTLLERIDDSIHNSQLR